MGGGGRCAQLARLPTLCTTDPACTYTRTHTRLNNCCAAVEHAQPEYIYHLAAQRQPNDPLYAAGSYTSGQWYLPHVWAPTAWATTVGSTAIRACVVSTLGKAVHGPAAAWHPCQPPAAVALSGPACDIRTEQAVTCLSASLHLPMCTPCCPQIDTGARSTHRDLRANIVDGWNRWGRGGVGWLQPAAAGRHARLQPHSSVTR